MPADFTKIIGFDTFNVTASSTARWGITRLRVALVLDNTGSMANSGKMAAMQSATKGLLTQLQNAVTTAGDVYVSVIPFVKDVNLGATNYNTDWVYWGTATQDPGLTDNVSWDALNGTCSNNSYSDRNNCLTKGGSCTNSSRHSQNSCITHGSCSIGGNTSLSTCNGNGTCTISGQNSQSNCTGAGTCSNTNYTSQSSCTGAGTCNISGKTSQSSCQSAHHCSVGTWNQSQCPQHGTWVAGVWTATPFNWTAGVWTPATFTPEIWTPGVWTPAAHSTWNGCVMDRGLSSGPDATYNFDTTADPPDPVTPRWSSLYPAEQYGSCPKAVKPLSYDWAGMRALVDSMSPAGNTNQAIGLQVGWLSLVGGGPFASVPMDPAYQYTQVIILLTDGLNTQDRWYGDQGSIDARQQITCDNVKASNVVMYTIQVNTGGDPTSTLLQNCASDSSKFYLLTSADQMTATFTTIGTNLTKLRVAQ